MTDLVYVKTFKGGSTIISEPLATLPGKLGQLETAMRRMSVAPMFNCTLGEVPDDQYSSLKKEVLGFLQFARSPGARIEGFGVSFSSALLHFYFPNVVPILDRRALNGSRIRGVEVNSQNQVKNLVELYPDLIDFFRKQLQMDRSLSLRNLDEKLFVRRLQVPPFKKKQAKKNDR